MNSRGYSPVVGASNVSPPTGVGTTMLVTRADDHPIGGGPTDEVAMARLGAHDRTVIDLERAHGQILFGFVRPPGRQRHGRGGCRPGVAPAALRRAQRRATDPGLEIVDLPRRVPIGDGRTSPARPGLR